MIKKIIINGVASYSQETTIFPSKINYIFGSNGTGKTTISKVIDDISKFQDCNIVWNSDKINTLVYNKDFITNNFEHVSQVKGIFTIGSDNIEVKKIINEKLDNIKYIDMKLLDLNAKKEFIEKEITFNYDKFKEKCWKLKLKYQKTFIQAFAGVKSSKDKFTEMCLAQDKNNFDLLDYAQLVEKYNDIYLNELQIYDMKNDVDFTGIKKYEDDSFLKENIIGKQDIPHAALIKKLNNSDWVSQGIDFYSNTNELCPFCQQKINKNILDELESFFDSNYKNKIDYLKVYKDNYADYFFGIVNELKLKINKDIKIIDYSFYENQIEILNKTYQLNVSKIEEKLKYPSNIVELENIRNIFVIIYRILKEWEKKVINNNELVANLKLEKTKLNSQIWKYIYNELEDEIQSYKFSKKSTNREINRLIFDLHFYQEKKNSIQTEIIEKQLMITNVNYSANEINKILLKFGFSNFKLVNVENSYNYKIIRENGEDCNDSLSEGEFNFITFLYFYYLVNGSTSNSNINSGQIVVIDDPISNLDSNLSLVVTNLIKDLANRCYNDENEVSQLFVLTHDVGFYKQFAFIDNLAEKNDDITFWKLYKEDNVTKIIEQKKSAQVNMK